ncbi:hypothetical protein SeseC_02558 [Streptococcus equi subsp. zooepidemicus ATCC 35246]|nr:hypothetical protein SeseC_02558 [Streptococcus equi subsp. zooepidemicus ATCC 35246]
MSQAKQAVLPIGLTHFMLVKHPKSQTHLVLHFKPTLFSYTPFSLRKKVPNHHFW